MRIESRCLQESTGSCSGYPIQEIVLEKRVQIPRAEEQELIERVSGELCPEGNIMQVPKRPEPNIW